MPTKVAPNPPTTVLDRDEVISVRSLRRTYGTVEAVRGIDLSVRRGEIFAFLGPNGAGKTTTVEILVGLQARTSGEVTVLGVDPAVGGPSWRARLGIVTQESQPDPGLTVSDCLELYAGYYPHPRDVQETLALVGLTARRNRLGEHLSGGERRRLDVALALIGDPELVFLDEPTTGFDPAARRAAWDMFAGLRELGKTVFLTTHYMEEAERLADRIAVIREGRIVAMGTPDALGGRDAMEARISVPLPPGVTVDDLPGDLRLAVRARRDGRVVLGVRDVRACLEVLVGWAAERGDDLTGLEVTRPSLEDVYIELIGHPQGGQQR